MSSRTSSAATAFLLLTKIAERLVGVVVIAVAVGVAAESLGLLKVLGQVTGRSP